MSQNLKQNFSFTKSQHCHFNPISGPSRAGQDVLRNRPHPLLSQLGHPALPYTGDQLLAE